MPFRFKLLTKTLFVMHVDFKVVKWQRVHIPIESENHFVEMLKNGQISSVKDMLNEDENCEMEPLSGCETAPMIDGEATIEAYDENYNLLYTNGVTLYEEEEI